MDLDANATTRLSAAALQAMLPWLQDNYGNPSSVHDLGKRARRALDTARAAVARAVAAHADEVFFFSSATEATNAVIASTVAAAAARLAAAGQAKLLPVAITSPAEHECVLKPLQWLAQQGRLELRYLAVDRDGRLQTEQLPALIAQADAAMPGRVAVCSCMRANNETGVISDLTAVAQVCRAARIPWHCDGVQALGKIALSFAALQADYLTLAAHKVGGPKGVGILVARRVAPLEAWVRGGPQEQGLRGGTENVAAIVGASVAVEQAAAAQPARAAGWAPLRDKLERRIVAALPGATVWGQASPRVANTSFISVPGIEAEAALMRLSQAGIFAASGAACSSSEPEPSHVLLAMGATRAEAHGAIRLSLPPELADGARPGDIPAAADTIIAALQKLQAETRPAGGATQAHDGNQPPH